MLRPPVKYFVVGGRGFVGAALFSALPHGVIGLRTGSVESDGVIQLRLEDCRGCAALPISEGDVVFLLAAISSPDECAREPERAWAVNVAGTSTLIKCALDRGARVVFFSSDAVYGERGEPFDEHSCCTPSGRYGEMKWALERQFIGHPLFKAIRLSYVFARGDKFSRYLAECSRRSEVADVFHPFYRAVIHRADVVAGALSLITHWDNLPSPVINFGGPQLLSRIDFAECLRDAHLTDLRLRVTEPHQDFFKTRPRFIAMASPLLPTLLGRQPSTLREAARIEFSSACNERIRDA